MSSRPADRRLQVQTNRQIQMRANKLLIRKVSDLKQTQFEPQMDQIRGSGIPVHSQIALLEAIREEIRSKISNLKELKSYLAPEGESEKVRTQGAEMSESELWEGIDGVEYKIIDRRDQKIYLNSVLEDYEDELFEQGKVIEHKRAIDAELKQNIRAKRMELEKTRCASGENSLSGSVSSLSMKSPRLFNSPRLYQEVSRVLAWR